MIAGHPWTAFTFTTISCPAPWSPARTSLVWGQQFTPRGSPGKQQAQMAHTWRLCLHNSTETAPSFYRFFATFLKMEFEIHLWPNLNWSFLILLSLFPFFSNPTSTDPFFPTLCSYLNSLCPFLHIQLLCGNREVSHYLTLSEMFTHGYGQIK